MWPISWADTSQERLDTSRYVTYQACKSHVYGTYCTFGYSRRRTIQVILCLDYEVNLYISSFMKTMLHVPVLNWRFVSLPGSWNFDVKVPMKSTNVPQGIWCWLLFGIPSSSCIPKSLVLALELLTDDVAMYSNNYLFLTVQEKSG